MLSTLSSIRPLSRSPTAMSLKFYRRHRGLTPITNNVYEDDEGKTAYKVHTPSPLKIVNRTTTISKALHNSPIDSVSRVPFSPTREIPSTSAVPPRPDGAETDDVASDEDEGGSGGEDLEPELGASGPESNPVEEVDGGSTSSPSAPTSPAMPRRRTLSPGERTNFMYLAQIDWKYFKSSKIRFATGSHSGKEVLVKDLFRKEGRSGR